MIIIKKGLSVLRRLYEYFTVDQKKEAMKKLEIDKLELQKEINQNIDSYPKIVREVLLHTLDSWKLEIEELENDIKNNRGPRKKI